MTRIATLLLFLLTASLSWGAEQTVWQIGKPDGSYKEFAIAGNYPAYNKFLDKPLVFEIGKSQAEADWPFIHPGPIDTWAGSRVHPWTIRFSLPEEPKGLFTLRLLLCDTQLGSPPVYTISIGGRPGQFRLPRGGGDDSLSDPAAGKPHKIELALPASLFKQGVNEIVLACAEGSWVQYDAVSLLNDREKKTPQTGIQSVAIQPTPFFIRTDGKVRRAVDVTVTVTAPPAELTLRIETAGERREMPIKDLPMIGDVLQEVDVPDSTEPLEVKVTALMGQQSKSATMTVKPQRKWRVYVAPSAHTDIGYTDVQPKCVERHNENLDLAAELIETYPNFKWNCEVAWQAENYLAMRKGERLERFLRLAHENRLCVQALYLNVLTGLCSHEELCRLTYAAHGMQRDHGIPYTSAMINDVPTWVASMPTILAGSGIRYFSGGSNNTRAVTFSEMYDKCPCWWEGPDGSRVLMMFQPGYAHAAGLGLGSSLATARERVLSRLRGYEQRENYLYDAIYVNGAVSDNQPLNVKLAEVARAWNERYAFPKLILCHNAEFFQYIEEKYGDKLPVYRGSGGTYWEDGAGSSALETTLCRNAHEAVGAAEKLLALGRRLGLKREYPQQAIYDAWRLCMLYDEHTWGAHCSVSQPESDFTKAQWKIKGKYAHDVHRQGGNLLKQASEGMASLVKTDGHALVVLNTMSFSRDDIVEVRLPDGMGVADGKLPSCRVGETTLMAVKDVPSCGYRVLPVGPSSDVPQAQPAEGSTIESRFYRVTFDPATGSISSLIDKQLDRELVDAKAKVQLNQYMYVAGGKGTSIENPGRAPKLTISSPEKAALRRLELGQLGQRMIVETSTTMTPKIVTEVTVYNDIKRVDITNRVTKTQTYDKEGVYFAFPFAGKKPVIRYEAPNAIMRPDKDMLPGACLDWFTVQHFVEVDSGDAAVCFSTPDAPLVCFQDINRGKWKIRLPIDNGHLYAYVMNNYWFTNYLAGQGGDFRFRFSITSRAKSDTVASVRAGWAVSNPLIAVKTDANPDGPLSAESASLIEIAEPNVLLIGTKQAEVGGSLVLRLWEFSGRATTAHVRLPAISVTKASLCNLVEEPQQSLSIEGASVAVPIRGAGLATLSLE